jgi:hypothetical protein
MKTKSVSRTSRRTLPPSSAEKLDRIAARVPIAVLALESGVPATYISEAERGIRRLTEDQERARREALKRLAVR